MTQEESRRRTVYLCRNDTVALNEDLDDPGTELISSLSYPYFDHDQPCCECTLCIASMECQAPRDAYNKLGVRSSADEASSCHQSNGVRGGMQDDQAGAGQSHTGESHQSFLACSVGEPCKAYQRNQSECEWDHRVQLCREWILSKLVS